MLNILNLGLWTSERRCAGLRQTPADPASFRFDDMCFVIPLGLWTLGVGLYVFPFKPVDILLPEYSSVHHRGHRCFHVVWQILLYQRLSGVLMFLPMLQVRMFWGAKFQLLSTLAPNTSRDTLQNEDSPATEWHNFWRCKCMGRGIIAKTCWCRKISATLDWLRPAAFMVPPRS